MFLAIKFKIRFRLRFCRKYGTSFNERHRKHIVRCLSFFSIMGPTNLKEETCKKIIV